MIRKKGHRVPPLSVDRIRVTAKKMRGVLAVMGAPEVGRVRVIDMIDIYLPSLMPNFCVEVLEDRVMGDDHARTYPDKELIQIKESVYSGALNGNGRDVFTIAHELGHLFLHKNSISYARSTGGRSMEWKVYEDSEWQGDCFAAEFLMPKDECQELKGPEEITERFGVSYEAATVRFEKLKKEK